MISRSEAFFVRGRLRLPDPFDCSGRPGGIINASTRPQVAGGLPLDLNAPGVALMLASQVSGLRVFAKAGFSPVELRRYVDTPLDLIAA